MRKRIVLVYNRGGRLLGDGLLVGLDNMCADRELNKT
jgi:hypothetical protein